MGNKISKKETEIRSGSAEKSQKERHLVFYDHVCGTGGYHVGGRLSD